MARITGMHRCGLILPPGVATRGEVAMIFTAVDPAAVTLEIVADDNAFTAEYSLALDMFTQAIHLPGTMFGAPQGAVRMRLVGGVLSVQLASPRGDVVLGLAAEWVRVMIGQIAMCAGDLASQGEYYSNLIEAELSAFLEGK